MSGIPDDPTRRHPEKPGDFPSKSVNGHDPKDRDDKAAKPDNQKAKKNDEKEKPESKH
jgi:hypothetical protein